MFRGDNSRSRLQGRCILVEVIGEGALLDANTSILRRKAGAGVLMLKFAANRLATGRG